MDLNYLLIDLKAELFRKREDFKQAKLQKELGNATPYSQEKKINVWSRKNKGVLERAQKDLETKTEEDDVLTKSSFLTWWYLHYTSHTLQDYVTIRAALERKAKLYEHITEGRIIPEDEENERYLVNFQKKSVDAILAEKREKERQDKWENENPIPEPSCSEEEWVDYVDTLGRSRRCMLKDLAELKKMDDNLKISQISVKKGNGQSELLSDDMRKEIIRQNWEHQEKEALSQPVGPTHYENVRYDEVRDHGVGYFSFSTEEGERQKQMETLKSLREQTVKQRTVRDKMKQKRQSLLEARLAKVRQRKNLKINDVYDDENYKGELYIDSTVALEPQESTASKSEIKETPVAPEKPIQVRPWDIGKDGLNEKDFKKEELHKKMSQMDWIEIKRAERPMEFAPPQFLYLTSSSGNNSKRKSSRESENLYACFSETHQETSKKKKIPCGSSETQPNPQSWLSSKSAVVEEHTKNQCSDEIIELDKIPLPPCEVTSEFTQSFISSSEKNLSIEQNSNLSGISNECCKDSDSYISEAISFFRHQSN
ncbi:coiled-coil domain-containing protein 174-like isoform X2 [Limulus polyphemus]|uniref:Coiled-coil domain-containing protein 174-like isoform X2 n=1 Tax=Limulus polyphemus TaxID=6850 RepID=A0ABM1T6C5_LIMPO|nr:coiled-coil domain-containing protein 174-like isoform X2 [Limulus polyphemus]